MRMFFFRFTKKKPHAIQWTQVRQFIRADGRAGLEAAFAHLRLRWVESLDDGLRHRREVTHEQGGLVLH